MSCWIIKTTEGSQGHSYWAQFLEDSVIAIGWKELDVNPSSVSKSELISNLIRIWGYSDFQGKIAANTIDTFASKIKIGDTTLICRGYPANSDKDVFLYGIARVTGNFRIRTRRNKWKFIRDAAIQPIEQYIPKTVFVETLVKRSQMKTIHSVSKDRCNSLIRALSAYGITLR